MELFSLALLLAMDGSSSVNFGVAADSSEHLCSSKKNDNDVIAFILLYLVSRAMLERSFTLISPKKSMSLTLS